MFEQTIGMMVAKKETDEYPVFHRTIFKRMTQPKIAIAKMANCLPIGGSKFFLLPKEILDEKRKWLTSLVLP